MKRVIFALSLGLNVILIATVLCAFLFTDSLFRHAIHPVLTSVSMERFASFPIRAGSTVFLGDSITAGAEWSVMFLGVDAHNRGISGDVTADVLARLDEVTRASPSRIFLLIGTNDLGHGTGDELAVANYETILDRIALESPDTRVYVQSVMPRGAEYRARVDTLNREIQRLATERGLPWIDLGPLLVDDDGSMRNDLSDDELHLNRKGYEIWRDVLDPWVRE